MSQENKDGISFQRRNRTKSQVNREGSTISKKIIRYLDESEHSDALAKIRQMSNKAKEKSSNDEEKKHHNDLNDINLQKNTEKNRIMFKNYFKKEERIEDIKEKSKNNDKANNENKTKVNEKGVDEPMFERRRNRTKSQVYKEGSSISKKIICNLDDESEHSDALAKVKQISDQAKEKSSNDDRHRNSSDFNDINLQKNTERNRLMFRRKENDILAKNDNKNTIINKNNDKKVDNEEKINDGEGKNSRRDDIRNDNLKLDEKNNEENESEGDEITFKRRRNRTKTQVNKSGSVFGQQMIRYLDEPEHSDALAEIRKISNKAKEKFFFNDKDLQINKERKLMFKNWKNDISDEKDKNDNNFNKDKPYMIKYKNNLKNEIQDSKEKKIFDNENKNEENKKEENADDFPVFERRKNRTKTQISQTGVKISEKIIRYLDDPEHSDALEKVRKISKRSKKDHHKFVQVHFAEPNKNKIEDNTGQK